MVFNFDQFYITFLGIFFGAVPFLFLGVLIATIIQLYAKNEWFALITKGNTLVSHLGVGLFGLFIPVCECGNIPVIKKLMGRGFSLSHAVVFLLAAPIVNPVTIYTTYQAFSDYPGLVGFRIIGGFALAIIIGLSFRLFTDHSQFILQHIQSPKFSNHHHHHSNRLEEFCSHFVSEFVSTMKYLIIGSLVASIFQTTISRDVLFALGTNPIIAIIIMILFAFIISVCSNVDAFIALSFSSIFSANALLGFLVFGPMIDIKTIVMIKSIFTTRFISLLSFSVFTGTVGLILLYYIFNLFGIV